MQQRVHPNSGFPKLVKNKLSIAPPSPILSTGERLKALSLILKDCFFSQTLLTLTTGVFLAGYALQFKAPNAIIGLLCAMPAMAQLLQLPGIYLVEKFRSRKQVTVVATTISRCFLLPMALAPLLPSSKLSLTVLALAYMCHTAIGAIATCAWNSWLKDVVLKEELGEFFSKRLALSTLITMVLTVAGGNFLDYWAHAFHGFQPWGYSVLFGVAILVGMLGIPLIHKMPEPASPVALNQTSLLKKLIAPFHNRNFRNLIRFATFWNFAINLAAPFFSVYMLTLLGYSMSMVTMLTMLSQLSTFLSLRSWGKLSDRFSNKAVLMICAPLFLFCVLAWTFATMPHTHFLTLPLIIILQLLLGVATAGVTLANGNIALKLAPDGEATSYLATYTATGSLAAGLAPILGGLFVDMFSHQELSLLLKWQAPGNLLNITTLDFTSWDFFFALAFLLGLGALAQLKRVRESGKSTRRRKILQELMNDTVRVVSPTVVFNSIGTLMTYSNEKFQSAITGLKKQDKCVKPPIELYTECVVQSE